MGPMYRVLGKRGRITIPFEIRKRVGFAYNDILSFTEQDDRTVVVKREKICDECKAKERAKDDEVSLLEFLNSLTPEEQHASYYAEHPTIELETAAGKALYTIFSVMKVQKEDAWYRFLTVDAETDFLHQIRYARECALYDTGIIPTYGQQLLTLSTCYGSSGGDGRLLIVAAKTE